MKSYKTSYRKLSEKQEKLSESANVESHAAKPALRNSKPKSIGFLFDKLYYQSFVPLGTAGFRGLDNKCGLGPHKFGPA